MGNVVIVNKKRLNTSSRMNDSLEENTVLLSLDEDLEQLNSLEGHQIYIPATFMNNVKGNHVLAYHELEQFPFFQAAKEIIVKEEETQGIFRMRRAFAKNYTKETILSDLTVISNIFGEPERVSIQKNGSEKDIFHVILMVQYVKRIMAHIDYTFGKEAYVELEWSSKKQIIEFQSEKMKPMNPGKLLSAPLQYSLESIIKSAKDVSDIQSSFKKYRSILEGGLT